MKFKQYSIKLFQYWDSDGILLMYFHQSFISTSLVWLDRFFSMDLIKASTSAPWPFPVKGFGGGEVGLLAWLPGYWNVISDIVLKSTKETTRRRRTFSTVLRILRECTERRWIKLRPSLLHRLAYNCIKGI